MNAKVLFTSQYLGQPVLKILSRPSETFKVLAYDCSGSETTNYLLLRSVSQLTDDEISNIADLYGWGDKYVTKDMRDERMLQFKIDLPCICIKGYHHRHMKFIFDYLTRIGILLPFTYLNEKNKPITLQPDDILKLGWAQLKTD